MIKGIDFFTKVAHTYGNCINDTKEVELFFKDFMNKTKGLVIVDFLDSDNSDCIVDVRFNHKKGLIHLLFRLPSKDPEEKMAREMVSIPDVWKLIAKFNNIRFIHNKKGECLAIVINTYTLRKKEIKNIIKKREYKELKNEENSFFSIDYIGISKKDLIESIRVMRTPINSFWIIPKTLSISAQDSERLLYHYNLDKLEKRLNQSIKWLIEDLKKEMDKEDEEDVIKMYGNKMRRVAESLFKLVRCFYQKVFAISPIDYDKTLGEIIKPLEDSVYLSQQDKDHIKRIKNIANNLSHDSGDPVSFDNITELYFWLRYFIKDFCHRIEEKEEKKSLLLGNEKPSPFEFIQKNLLKWNFIDEINKVLISDPSNCLFKVVIENQSDTNSLFSLENNYLCKDGVIRKLSYDDNSILTISNRNDVIHLLQSIQKKVREMCINEGVNDNYIPLSITAEYIKKNKPIHLFTFKEIKSLMATADDSVNNKLVIDENGYAKIIQDVSYGYLYPVSQETWGAGNNYVGKYSSLSDARPSYHLCLMGWLHYLKTGDTYYNDCFPSIESEANIIKEIKKYY